MGCCCGKMKIKKKYEIKGEFDRNVLLNNG